MLKWLSGKGNELSESEAENKLLAEKWHTYSGYADLDRIKQSMISVKHFIEKQLNLEYYFPDYEFNYLVYKSNEKELCNSARLKKDLRTGMPIKYMREIILRMFNVDYKDANSMKDNYKTRFLSIFKNRDPMNLGDHVPYLSYLYTLEDNLPIHFLTPSGLEAVKELLWLVYSVVPNIEFCPLLLKIISFSLIFLTKEECFAYIKNLIIHDYSVKKLSNIRFRLRFNYEENKRLIPAFIESFKSISKNTGKEIVKKLEKIGFETEILIEDMFFNLFLNYLNFSLLYRVFILYLNEGSKILFRVAYAILKTLKNDIMNISKSETVISTIKNKAFEISDDIAFFYLVFNYGLKEKNNKYDEVVICETFEPLKTENYYIPTINGESNILTDDDIFQLWNIFPDTFKTKDAKMIFSTDYHGYSLDKIYEVCLDSENSCFNCFLIILTKKKDVFGVIMSLPLDINRTGFYKPAYTGLFVLRPYISRFDVISPSDRMVLCGEDKVIIGLGQEGPALEIEKDLLIGFSYKSEIFASPGLATSNLNQDFSFQIDKLEVYILY